MYPFQSLIDEFIQFMEKESDPKERRKVVTKFHSVTSSIYFDKLIFYNCILLQKETSSGSPNILFTNSSTLPDVMLPTLSQHSIGHNSTHILKDVLQ